MLLNQRFWRSPIGGNYAKRDRQKGRTWIWRSRLSNFLTKTRSPRENSVRQTL
ncbi:MAG: hypothetical protein QNJ41_07910 [Xenococcaceae cyanobacterium MO_188.B32]|nr:hypothetical protein [Xenococcaceae cyanobacterium MO_188.B32]